MLYVKIAIVIVFAVAGYQESRRFEKQYGRSPWGWPAGVWAVVLGLSFVIGLLLIAVAERAGRSQAGHQPPPVAPVTPTGQPPVSYGSGTTVLPKP